MFKRKKKSTVDIQSVINSVDYAAEVATADPTKPYLDFIEDLAVLFPGIVTPRDNDQLFYSGWARPSLSKYEVWPVKRAANAIRAAQAKEAEATEQKAAKALIESLRATEPRQPESIRKSAARGKP